MEQRKEKQFKSVERIFTKTSKVDISDDSIEEVHDDNNFEDACTVESEYEDEMRKKIREDKKHQKKVFNKGLEKVIETVDRAGISPNMAAQIINDVNVASGHITEENQENVVYRMKVKRMADKLRNEKVEEKKGRVVDAVMFDERKDLTRNHSGIIPNIKRRELYCFDFSW